MTCCCPWGGVYGSSPHVVDTVGGRRASRMLRPLNQGKGNHPNPGSQSPLHLRVILRVLEMKAGAHPPPQISPS